MTRTTWRFRLLVLGVSLCLWGPACVVQQGTVHVKDGKQYGVTSSRLWRARWWNYYERGASYAAGAFWTEAMADFQEALRQRAADQRRARTYGLHFLDYFPHRELGVVYYELGRYPEAVGELEASLGSVETAKAKFYLNKARQKVLEQTRADAAPPRIVIESPGEGLLTSQRTLTVQGYVEDDTYVSGIAINDRAQFIELAQPRVAFRQDIPLQDGPNTIDIVAVDLVGQPVRQRRTVLVDRQGPLLSLAQVQPVGVPPQQRVYVSGFVSDASGVVRFMLADTPVSAPSGNEGEFRQEVRLAPGVSTLPFEVEDAVGNVVRGVIRVDTVTFAPPRIQQGGLEPAHFQRWAALTQDGVMMDIAPGAPEPLRLAQDPSGDRSPPVIKVMGGGTEQTTYYDSVYLEGEVTDASPITAFTVNGESLWRREGQQLFFGYIAVLKPGTNLLHFAATDKAGNTAQLEVMVERKVEEVKRLDARLRVTVIPLEKKGEAATLAETAYEHLVTAFVSQGRFQLIEREQLDKVLGEQQLSQTALVEPQTAARVGKIMAAEGMVVGTATETPKALEVFIRFVDVETAAVLAAEDVYGEDLTGRGVRPLMEGLALKMRNHFPLQQGLVLKTEGKKVFLDLGDKQVMKHGKVLIFREGEAIKHPVTGKLLGAPTEILGEVVVDTVAEDFSQGTLRQVKNPEAIMQLDKAITK